MLSLKETLSRVFGRPAASVRSDSEAARVRSLREPRRLRMEWLEDRMLLCNPGELDLTFGSGGIAVTDFNGGSDIAKAVAVQSDGKIVAAGYATELNGNNIFALARYNADGSLDTSFDGDGRVTTFHATQQANGKLTGSSGLAFAVAVQSDGKIIAAGSSSTYSGKSTVKNGFTLVRYNSNGSLDTSFGNQGIAQTTAGGLVGADIFGIVLQTDGKIVAAGGNTADAALARFNSNGTLDTSFSGDGVVLTDLGGDDGARAVALQSDGKIVVSGTKVSSTKNSSTVSGFVARYTNTGNLDSSFGTGGVTAIPLGTYAELRSVAIQSDGRVVAAGRTSQDMLTIRLDTNGAFDTTFDGDGVVTVDFGGGSDRASGVAIQPNGQIVLAAEKNWNTPQSQLALVRLNLDGSLDTTFGTSGKVVAAPEGSRGTAVALQADGQIVTAGIINGNDFLVARFCV